MADKSILRMLLNKASMQAIMMWGILAVASFWFIGALIKNVTLMKVGVPLTVLFMGIALAASWKLINMMGGPTARTVGAAPIVFGFFVMVIVLLIAVVILPMQFAELYAITDLKIMIMSLI